ncbi:MAG: hypothetical protein ACM3SP_26095 [Chloroflexota bacterium]
MAKMMLVLVALCLFAWPSSAEAQYVLVLKNGRQITVQSYREDGSMVKFFGLGGEIAISKEQIQFIRRAGEADRSGTPSLGVDQLRPTTPAPSPETAAKPIESKPAAPPAEPAETPAAKRAAEEKAYQQKVKELTARLQQLREQYAIATRGNIGPEPQFFTTEEAFKGHQEDLLSRLRDAQLRQQGLSTGSQLTSPPFALDPPPTYSQRERELSDLRAKISQTENERQRLIDEMKAKNFDTGSLFLD